MVNALVSRFEPRCTYTLANKSTNCSDKFSNSLIGGGTGKGRRIGRDIEGNLGYTFTPLADLDIASHAGVFKGARIPSLPRGTKYELP